MNYSELSFQALRDECKERGLKAGGGANALIDRLTDNDLGHAPEVDAKPKQTTAGLKAGDPNPNNPNYDMAGRWLRRSGSVRPDGVDCAVTGRWN